MVSLTMSAHTSLSPVSSIKRLLGAQPTPSGPPAHKAPIELLPPCITREIGRQSDLRDVLHFSLCSRRLSKILAPVLYASVDLKTNRHCKTTLIAFSKRPDISRHIRRLVVRPNSVEWTDPGDEMDEDLVANLLARMADRLRALEVFEWDGMEMPGDELWSALKTSCRHLKNITTTIGEDSLNPSSPLWDFNDLRQVSLKIKCHSLDWLADGLPKTEKLPRKFWAMLIERCPRLEALRIEGSAPSPRIFDIRHVTSGRWPRLRSIVLGDMVMIASTKGEEQARKDHAAFMAFFVAHPGLTHIALQHAAASPHFPGAFVLPASALPNVHTFGGPLKFIKTLPFPQRLRHLTLTSLHHTTSSFPPTFAALQELRWLESLTIWVDLSFGVGRNQHASFGYGGRTSGESLRGHNDILVFRNLMLSRPGLRHLEVACFTRPTFSIREFSSILQSSPSLESFVLTKVHKSNEEDMTRCATRVAIENPNLRRFTLRTTHDSWFSPSGGRVKHLGVYEALDLSGAGTRLEDLSPISPRRASLDGSVDESGLALSQSSCTASPLPLSPTAIALQVHEWGQRSIMGKESWKHFVHPVSPSKDRSPPSSWHGHGHVGTKKHRPARSLSINRGQGGFESQDQSQPLPRQETRPRRASWSVVGSTISAIWEGKPASQVQPVSCPCPSSRSSFSSVGSNQGAQVTWGPPPLEGNKASLGRSGSASTSASESTSSGSLSTKSSGRGSWFGMRRQKDGAKMECIEKHIESQDVDGYVLV